VKTISSKEKISLIVPGDHFSSLIDEYGIHRVKSTLLLPNKLPMIVKPKEYNITVGSSPKRDGKLIEILGGYLLNDKEYAIPMIISHPLNEGQTIIKEKNVVYNTVNYLSSVPYKINEELLNFILEFGIDYKLIIDPNFEHPLETKLKQSLAYATAKKLTAQEKRDLDSFNSQRNLERNILGLAKIYKNIPSFYFPVRIDFRGRVYCEPEYLNYQSTELAKSLLLFANNEKVEMTDIKAINYLMIFGANAFGLDKKSFNERIK